MNVAMALVFSSMVASATPEASMTAVQGGVLGGVIGALTGGVVLGGATFATGRVISDAQCRAGCTDSDGTTFIFATPYAAALGLVGGAVAGGLVGALLADGDGAPHEQQCGSAVTGLCPGSRWCL